MTDDGTRRDGVDPAARGVGATGPQGSIDLDRRGFFRAFGRQTVQAAGSMAGAVEALRRGSSAAAAELVRTGLGDPSSAARRIGQQGVTLDPSPANDHAVAGFRSPYRLDGGTLVLVDQRALPAAAPDVVCERASDVAGAMRNMVVRGAPVLGQVAAYGLALTAARTASLPSHRRDRRLRSDAAALRAARPSVRAVGWALDRMFAVLARLDDADGPAVARALRAEADAIATEAMHGHAAISRHGAGALPGDLRALQILLHGNAGALAGGMVGTAVAVVERLHADERDVHAWVTETRPTFEGARLTAWELAHAGVPTTVIADGAVAWLLAQRRIDALLLGADWIAANGDTANVVGSRMVAALCFRHRVPVFVCAPATTGDPATPTGDDIPTELRPGDELFDRAIGGARLTGVDARNPASDIVPAAIISAFVTEHGVVRPPFGATPGGAS